MHKKQWRMALAAVIVALSLILPGTLLAQGHKGQVVKFGGTAIEVLPTPDGALSAWDVDGYRVLVTDTTHVVDSQGELADGAQVMVVGRQEAPDGAVTAIVLRVLKPREPRTEKVFVKGPIQDGALDEEGLGWMQVADTMVWVDEETIVEGDLTDENGLVLGLTVIVRGTPTSDPAGVQAESIRVRVPEEELDCDQIITGTISAILFESEEPDAPVVGYAIDDGIIENGEELIEVPINPETQLPKKPLEVGDEVRVCAQEVGETLVALKIGRLEPDEDGEDCVPEELTLSGPIQRFPASLQGSWLVSGTHVVVTDTAVIVGFDEGVRPCIGCEATIEAFRCGQGVPHATRIEITAPEETPEPESWTFEGEVKQRPQHGVGNWLVDTWRFTSNRKTNIPVMPEVGDMVSVTVMLHGHGMLFATSITLIEEPSETPTIPAQPPDDESDSGKPKPHPTHKPKTVALH